MILAVNQIVETYHHSDMPRIARLRARTELWGGMLGDIARCMFCFSHWAAFGVAAWYGFTLWYFDHYVVERVLALMPLYALAFARGAQIVNDLLHPVCRTPNSGGGFPPLDPGE
jgi:hypothetical protein